MTVSTASLRIPPPMTKRKAFPPEQEKFLLNLVDAFLKVCAVSTVKRDAFFADCKTQFYDRWPAALPSTWTPDPYEPPEKSASDGSEEIDEEVSEEELERRIREDAEQVRPEVVSFRGLLAFLTCFPPATGGGA